MLQIFMYDLISVYGPSGDVYVHNHNHMHKYLSDEYLFNLRTDF